METQIEHALTAYRRRTGQSLDDLAKRAGTSKSWLSRIESGSEMPSAALIGRLVQATGGEVRPNDFFNSAEASS